MVHIFAFLLALLAVLLVYVSLDATSEFVVVVDPDADFTSGTAALHLFPGSSPVRVLNASFVADDLMRISEPVLVRGSAVLSWPVFTNAGRSWSNERLDSILGETHVHISQQQTVRMHSIVQVFSMCSVSSHSS